jgi:hypothetical protein
VITGKEFTNKARKVLEYKHRKTNSRRNQARADHTATPGTPQQRTTTRKSRSAPCEAGKASHNPHARGQEGRPPACDDHAPSRKELHDPPGSQRDRRGPKTATERFMSKKDQPRLTDLTLNTISAGHSPTPVYLLEPATKTSTCSQQRQRKTKERKTKQNNLHQCKHLEEINSNSPNGLETKPWP